MCGIAGYFSREDIKMERLEAMMKALRHRGPDDEGIILERCCGLVHTRLSIRDVAGGIQPMTRTYRGRSATIVYNGEIYNIPELKHRLSSFPIHFETTSDTEVILYCYLVFGTQIFKDLNGIFAFAIYENKTLILVRDHIGVKPLFYYHDSVSFLFASEIKGIFAGGVKPAVNEDSWREIIALGPAHTLGCGVFQNIFEVLPAHYLVINRDGIKDCTYWKLESCEHTETYPQTVAHCSELITDSIKRQMVSDIPICTFLSGGLDSSLVSAVVAKELGAGNLRTYSFDFVDNHKNFKANSFQSSEDRPFVDIMVEHIKSRHTYLECNNENQITCLLKATDARDMPCMADVESSMLYFCSLVAKECKVTLTGECADEIFGGYPWFHRENLLNRNTFPWSYDMPARTYLFQKDFIEALKPEEYAARQYQNSVAECPVLESESDIEKKRRRISWLNIRWFMMTLLNRMDRCSMYSGLEARVPYADYRILEYVFNIPWKYKCYQGQTKSLIVECAKNYLPPEVLYRKKSPYPKTYDPKYEQLLGEMVQNEMERNPRLAEIVDKNRLEKFISSTKDYGRPWYGQLMAGPQMLAYLLQIGYWIRKYQL